MKKTIYILICAALAASCNSDGTQSGPVAGEGALRLSASVEDAGTGVLSRAPGDDFFDEGYDIDVYIRTNTDTSERNYRYSYTGGGIFESAAPFYFNLDDSYITHLTAIWPTQEQRDQGLVVDQRELEDFRLADWLTAEATTQNIVPTGTPVPLNFVRENTMLEFEIAGQNAEGVDIKELVIEIQDGNEATAFWAYCGSEDGKARLILDSNTTLYSEEDFYLIGRMKVTDEYEYTIIFPAIDLALESGKKYLVTLTSQGYDADMFVYIGGWVQDGNSGIGIPFAAPEPTPDGNFLITEPEQLVTMSYLIRHYPNPATYNWVDKTYVIADGFMMSEELAALYIPVPASLGVDIRQGTVAVTEVAVEGGAVLQLYDNDN